MTMLNRCWKLALVWMLSLTVVAAAASTMLSAQRTVAAEGQILSGGDVGFRLEGYKGDTPIGTLMVRVNGKWVEAALAPKLRPAR